MSSECNDPSNEIEQEMEINHKKIGTMSSPTL